MKAHRALEIRSVFVIYGLLAILTFAFDWIYRGSPFASWMRESRISIIHLIFATMIFISYLASYFFVTRFTESGAELEKAFRQILTPISYFQILILAVLSGGIEEWFFRGLLVPQLGVIMSSVIFGLAHLMPSRGTWLWTLASIFAGIALGLLYSTTGSLALVSTVHIALNFVLLFYLNNSAQ